MKKYKYRNTKKLRKQLIPFYERFKKIEAAFYEVVDSLEKEMARDTGIEDIEFFFSDGECAGIGNVSRTMDLIHFMDLEEEKSCVKNSANT